MNRLDQFVKDKLDRYELKPSASAWLRVETQQSKKNKLPRWLWRAAAIFVVAGSVATYLNLQKPKTASPTLSLMSVPKQLNMPSAKTTHAIEKPENKTKSSLRGALSTRVEKPLIVDKPKAVMPLAQNEPDSLAKEEHVTSTQNHVAALPPKPMKITFSLPTLPSQQTLGASTIAQHEPGKKTVFERALQGANEWRSLDVYGQLRDAKDDLIDRTFRKEKKPDSLRIDW
jgi:hypothetical protein